MTVNRGRDQVFYIVLVLYSYFTVCSYNYLSDFCTILNAWNINNFYSVVFCSVHILLHYITMCQFVNSEAISNAASYEFVKLYTNVFPPDSKPIFMFYET
jgi:hypothetical protein